MAKLIVVLPLLFGGADAMGIYGGEKNGCCDPCADVITTSATSFPTIESDTCYVVDGTFPSSTLTVPDGVDCAKITVPSGSTISYIKAHLPRPAFCPTKR